MIEKTLINKLKKIKGSILGIGIDSINILKTIDKNKKITYCDLLLSKSLDNDEGKGKLKRIKFKKLKKYYKHNNINTIIACFDKIPYKRSFIKNSVHITKDTIYLYTNLDNEYLDTYVKRYTRYNITYQKLKQKEETIYILNLQNKTKIGFKSIFYYIYDLLYDIANYISDFLID